MENIKELNFYGPITNWIKEHLPQDSSTPILLGISAPQGTGKSTITQYLVSLFNDQLNINTLGISIDDFYLTHDDQNKLAKKYTNNQLLQKRGHPGTHDLPLLYQTIEQLKNNQLPVNIPRYDKTKHNGLGDRLPKENGEIVNKKLNLIILEGWMLGFAPTNQYPPELVQINNFLDSYKQLNKSFDLFIHLHAQEVEYVLNWRAQAEQKSREQGKGAMSETEIIDYLKSFLSAYRTYNPTIINKSSIQCPTLQVKLDEARNAIQFLEL